MASRIMSRMEISRRLAAVPGTLTNWPRRAVRMASRSIQESISAECASMIVCTAGLTGSVTNTASEP